MAKTSTAKARTPQEFLRAVEELAASKGGVVIAESYRNSSTPARFQCQHGHQWDAVPHNLLYKGSWCPHCHRRDTDSVLQSIREIARSHGGRCLSETYEGQEKKLSFECEHDHRFSALPGNILYRKSWCPVCLGRQPSSSTSRKRSERFEEQGIERLRQIASDHGGRWIESPYKGSLAKYQFECSEGHVFEKHIHHAKNHWCGECAR